MVPNGGLGGRGEELAVPFSRFMKQPHRRTWFWDALFEAVGGLCLGTEMHGRYTLTEEERGKTIRGRNRGGENRLSISVLGLGGMVIVVLTTFVMIVITKDRPARVGNPVLVMGVGSSAVQWVMNSRGAREKLFGRDTDNLGGVF